jgi:AcrR family transcriptional regulator
MIKERKRKGEGAYHHGDLRAAVIAKALEVVGEAGPEAVSLKALSQALGVSQPAPYQHFADRNALMIAVALEGFAGFISALQAHAGDLSAMAKAYFRFARQHPGLYRLMFGSKLLGSALPGSDLKMAGQESFFLLEAAIAAHPSPVPARRRALTFWAALHGLVVLEQERLIEWPMTDATTMDQLVDDLVKGTQT